MTKGLFIGVALLSSTLAAQPSQVAQQTVEGLVRQGKALGWTFKVGYHPVLDMPEHHATGYLAGSWRNHDEQMYVTPVTRDLPAEFDWRDRGTGFPPIKNQRNCGSCWAFGTNAVLEGIMWIKDHVTRDMSEQYLVSCNKSGYGCDGGNFAHSYHKAPYGAPFSVDFPYTAKDSACKTGLSLPYQVESWSYVGSSSSRPTLEQIKQAIYTYGPVAAVVAANTSFMSYKSGVYNACDGRSINHLISIVGWNDSTGSWIMRNSWGEGWGEKGYMRIKYNCNYIGDEATFATYKPKCTPQPLAYAGQNRTIPKGSYARLGGMELPSHTYSWTPAVGLDDAATGSPLASPLQTTTYTLRVSNNCGTAEKRVTVTVTP